MKAGLVDALAGRERDPEGLKPTSLSGLNGTAEEAAEKVERATSAAKAADRHKGIIAALKRCATQNQIFPASCEAVPYPKPAYETGSKDLRQQLRELLQGRVCLMGLGNVDCGDDGVGVRLAEELLEAGVPDVVVARTTPEDYVGRIADQGFDLLIFLDAVAFGAPPGSVALLDASEICARYPQISTHKISLGVLAKWVRATGRTKVWLLGVQPQSIRLGETLSPTVSATRDLIRSLLVELAAGKKHVGTAASSAGSGQALDCPAERNSAVTREESAITV